MRKTATLLALLVTCSAALAQMPSFDPPKELDTLKWTLGKWKGELKFSFQGTDTTAPMELENQMDGQFIRSASSMVLMGMRVTETGFIGYDPDAKAYKTWTFTNLAATPRLETGKPEGDKWVWLSEPWALHGEKSIGRTTITKVSDTEMSFLLEMKNGDAWDRFAEGSLHKS